MKLQDRLVKAMRLEGVSTIAEANAFLPGYMARHNQRFAKTPFDPRDLRAEMVWREQCKVTGALTFHYNKAPFILTPTEISRPLAGKRVDVCEYPDGRLEILRHGEHSLPYEMFDKIRQLNQAAIVDNKHLDAALAMAKMIQEQLPTRKRNNNEPSRLSQHDSVFPAPAQIRKKRVRPPLYEVRALPNDRWRTACVDYVAHADVSYDEDTMQHLWCIDSAYDRRKYRRALHGMQTRHTERYGDITRLL